MTRQLNDTTGICRDSRRVHAVLHLHGVPIGNLARDPDRERDPESENFLRQYRVFLYQHHVLQLDWMEGTGVWLQAGVTNQSQNRFERIAFSPEDLEQRRVVQLAIRAIYSLGLDAGIVCIGVNSPVRMYVMEVQADFAHYREMEVAYLEKVKQQLADVKQATAQPMHVMIGADPEFALRDIDGKMGIASRYLEKQGSIGYDAQRLREVSMHNLHPLVELRPEPSYSPRDVFRHLLQIMRIGLKKIPDSFEWVAGGMPFMGYPIGGHIHFSGITLTFEVLRKLDAYLALPLTLIEDESCKRRRPHYGFLGDFREQAYGGFEYRTLPSWLVSPLVTQGVLALAKVIATHHRGLTQDPLAAPLIQKAYYQGDKLTLYPIVANLWAELRLLTTYQTYQIELDAFYQYVMKHEPWKSDQDIRLAWGLITMGRKSAADLLHSQQPRQSMV